MNFLVKIAMKRGAGKVHQSNGDNRPVCGGGRGGLSVKAWQSDIGPANCKRCEQVLEQRLLRSVKTQSELVL